MSAFELGRLIGNFVGPVLLIGALVYVMRGGKVSFTEGVRHPLVLSLIVLTIAANAIPNPNSVQGDVSSSTQPPALPNAGSKRVFSDGARVSFYNGCIDSTEARMDRDAAGKACACVITEIENTFSPEQFKSVSASMEKTGVASAEIGALIAKCEPQSK